MILHKKQKIKAGVYSYRGYKILKVDEDYGVRGWNITNHTLLEIDVRPTLKKAMDRIDFLCICNERQERRYRKRLYPF